MIWYETELILWIMLSVCPLSKLKKLLVCVLVTVDLPPVYSCRQYLSTGKCFLKSCRPERCGEMADIHASTAENPQTELQ